MGLDDVLRLGHLVLAIDQTSDRPKSRTTLLDYMSPEMLSIRPHNEHELALLDDSDSEDDSSSNSGSSSSDGGQQRTQPQQQWESLQEPAQVPLGQLGLLGAQDPASPAAARTLQADRVLKLDEDPMGELDSPHHSQQHVSARQQQQHGKWMQQPAQLDPSRQASLDPAALEQLDEAAGQAQVQSAFQAAALQPAAAVDRLEQRERAGRRGSRAFLGPCGGTGRAEWEYQDHYDEKVDIWQLGCMLHELLCGSMPFEVGISLSTAAHQLQQGQVLVEKRPEPCWLTNVADCTRCTAAAGRVLVILGMSVLAPTSTGPLLAAVAQLESKLESAGLSLWADIEVLPGNIPPDCADFIQQALTKDPRLRPSAQQLLQHPWLARCQAGDPWRDPVELEAARRCVDRTDIGAVYQIQCVEREGGLGSSLRLCTAGTCRTALPYSIHRSLAP